MKVGNHAASYEPCAYIYVCSRLIVGSINENRGKKREVGDTLQTFITYTTGSNLDQHLKVGKVLSSTVAQERHQGERGIPKLTEEHAR